MADWYTYGKKRRDFGKDPKFANSEVKMLGYVPGTAEKNEEYIDRNPNFHVLDNAAEMSEHSFNTERVSTADRGMSHKEGGFDFLQLHYTNFKFELQVGLKKSTPLKTIKQLNGERRLTEILLSPLQFVNSALKSTPAFPKTIKLISLRSTSWTRNLSISLRPSLLKLLCFSST